MLTCVIYVFELFVVLGNGDFISFLEVQESPSLYHLSLSLSLHCLLWTAFEAIKFHSKIANLVLLFTHYSSLHLCLPFAPVFRVLAYLLQYFFGHFLPVLITPKKRSLQLLDRPLEESILLIDLLVISIEIPILIPDPIDVSRW